MPTDPGELTYDPELAPGYFVQIRSDFLRSPAFSCTAKVLYEVLLTYAAAGATAWPGQDTLSGHLGVTARTIRTVLQEELIPAGLLTIERLGLTRTNRYHLRKLQTLPPRSDRKSFPIKRDRKSFPIKSGNLIRTRPEPIADKVESEETQSEKIEEGLSPALAELNRRYQEAERRRQGA